MPRRVSRRRLAVAAVLVVLAVLPHVVTVYGAMYHPDWREDVRPVVHVMVRDSTLFHLDTSSVERAKSAGYWWEQYRQYWWILAAVAACIVLREFLPVPRVFASDDE
jgi:hypothetical protein